MEKCYVFGHMNPDTDSVCASITLANLKRNIGINAEERVLGNINKETKYVLDYFKVKTPKYLNDVKLKIKDLKYRKKLMMNEYSSIEEVYNYMLKENTTGVPIVDENNKLINLITAKDILNKLLHLEEHYLVTSYDNILKTLDGEKIVKVNDEIKGKITAVTFSHSTFESVVNLTSDDILIVGDRHYIIDLGVNKRVKLIIVIGDSVIKKEHIKLARKNKVNIIRTKLNSFETSRIILYSNYIKNILNINEPYIVRDNDYYTDFVEKSENLKIDNYPVVDKNGKCLGLLRKSEINKLSKRKVILVDHNETEQSASGLDEAEIVEVVDHHKIGSISTNAPINFRNMIVGSTNTIIYFLYKENGIKITKQMAGLMISGIISDTLNLQSPTTTDIDKKVIKELNKIANLNINKYAKDMFKAGTSLEGLSVMNVISEDLKVFNEGDISFGVSQAFTMDYESILSKKEEYIEAIKEKKENMKLDYFIFVITDILSNGSYILVTEEDLSLVSKALNNPKFQNGEFVPKIVSRKKQVVPIILDALEK